MAVAYVDKREVTVDGGTSITIQIPAGASEGDLLIAYIAKDDNVAIYNTGDYSNWNMLYNIISDSQTCLYVAWRIATAGDVSGAVSWTWNGDSEDWVGEILCYSGADTTTPIHASGSDYLDSSATPTAPSVAFTDLTAGSLVLQCFGCDFDDEPRVVPSQLTSRFNQHQATDIGGAGGDITYKTSWVSPTGFDDPDTAWSNEGNVYDENTDSGATNAVSANSWGNYLELTIDAITCSAVRFWAYNFPDFTSISLDVYYASAWHNIYEGAYANLEWITKAIGSVQTVTAMRAKFYNDDSSPRTTSWREASFFKLEALEGTGNTGTAVFGIPALNEWTAATLVIEAASAAGIFYKSIAGAFSATGAVVKLPKIPLAGVFSATGSIVKKTLLNLSGNFGLTGIVSSIFKFPKSLAGAFGLTGTVSKLPKITLGGAFDFTGTVGKLIKKGLSGVFDFIGSGVGELLGGIFYKTIEGAFSFTGGVSTVLTKFKSLAGSFDFSGSLSRLTKKALSGSFDFVGSVIIKQFKSLSGTFGLTGTIVKLPKIALSGALTLTGTIGKLIKKTLSGSFDFTGSIARKMFISLSGAFSSTGTIGSILTKFKSLSGVLDLTGTLARKIYLSLSGVFGLTGSLSNLTKFTKVLAGVFGFTGTLGKLTKKTLSGSLTFSGRICFRGFYTKVIKAISTYTKIIKGGVFRRLK